MYADDLIIISASLCELQHLLDLCARELDDIGLSVNANKCSILRAGKRFKANCASVLICGSIIPQVTELKCLGVYLKSGLSLRFSFDNAKKKFYRAANAILSKVGNKAEIVMPLINAQCLPLLLYCVEGMQLNKSEKLSLSHPLTVLMAKLFGTFNLAILEQCMWYMNYLPLNYCVDLRAIKFLTKVSCHTNVLLTVSYSIFSPNVLKSLKNQYEIHDGNHKSWRECIWDKFSVNVGLVL